jgi:hypothetical protein
MKNELDWNNNKLQIMKESVNKFKDGLLEMVKVKNKKICINNNIFFCTIEQYKYNWIQRNIIVQNIF